MSAPRAAAPDPIAIFGQERWEWMLRHADDSRVPVVITVCTLSTVLSLVFLGMRLWARRLSFGWFKLDWSDWLCVVSVAATLVMVGDILVGIRYGLGRHMPAVTDLRALYIVFIIANAMHPAAMAGLKLSILVMFYSIFPSSRFRWCCVAMGIFIIVWAVVSIVVGIALCIPIEKLWDASIQGGVCLPLAVIGQAVTSAHILTDLILLFMPVPLVLRLQTTRANKALVISTFMVGGIVCITSIARLPLWVAAGKSTGDFAWDNVPGAMLALAEITIGVLATSAPLYRPLLRYVGGNNSPSGSRTHASIRDITTDGYQLGHKAMVTIGSQHGAPGRTFGRSIAVTDEFELSTYHNVHGDWRPLSDTPDEEDTQGLFQPRRGSQANADAALGQDGKGGLGAGIRG